VAGGGVGRAAIDQVGATFAQKRENFKQPQPADNSVRPTLSLAIPRTFKQRRFPTRIATSLASVTVIDLPSRTVQIDHPYTKNSSVTEKARTRKLFCQRNINCDLYLTVEKDIARNIENFHCKTYE